jgi:hypothetical protein
VFDVADPPDGLSEDHTWTFQTPDSAPEVTSTAPADGDIDVDVQAPLTVEFDGPVAVDRHGVLIECGITSIGMTPTIEPTRLTLDPSAALPFDTDCTLIVRADAVTDTDDIDPLNAMAGPLVVRFHTEQRAPSRLREQPATDGRTPSTSATTGSPTQLRFLVTDQLGDPLAGVLVYIEVRGANPVLTTGRTGTDGIVRWSYTGTKAGVDTITASSGGQTLSVTRTWSAPAQKPDPDDPGDSASTSACTT